MKKQTKKKQKEDLEFMSNFTSQIKIGELELSSSMCSIEQLKDIALAMLKDQKVYCYLVERKKKAIKSGFNY